MRQRLPRAFIVSAELAHLSPSENAVRTTELGLMIAEIFAPHAVLEGRFQGVKEISYLILGAEQAYNVFRLAEHFEQHSYLVLAEDDRTAYLVHVNSDKPQGYHQHLGRFVAQGSEEPEGDFTKHGDTYFQVIPSKGVDLPEGF